LLAAVAYLKANDKYWDQSKFETACGIGVVVTDSEVANVVNSHISANKDKIIKDRYKALPLTLKELANNPMIMWADPKLRAELVNKAFEELLGPKDERDTAPVKKVGTLYITLT
jgi:glutaminyl-tRNA synthetase